MKPNRVKQKFIKPTLAVGRSNSMPVKALAVPIACFVFTFVFLFTGISEAQLAKGANKFLGNITTNGRVRDDFISMWNQITGENEHKWGSVERTRDQMNWSGGDNIANYAKQHGIPWKFHTLIWGSQYPDWMNNLSTSEQKAEIIEWFDAAAARYPDVQMIDVVNEAYMSDPNNWNAGKHAPIPFREALGGTGSTGYEWIVQSFKMARERWPNAILIYNDYNTLEWNNEIQWIKQIIPKLIQAGAPIDAVGFQAHGLKNTSASTLKSRLDDIWNSIKVPMLISEYDIGEGDDQAQLNNYKNHITEMWNHPKVVGITIWGYILGSTWVENTGIIRTNGQDRPAMTWLREFIKNNPNPPNDYPNFLKGGGSSYSLTVSTRGRGSVTRNPDNTTYEKDAQVILTATPSEGWVFSGWTGSATGNQNPLTVKMDATKEITANFTTTDGKQDLVVNGSFSAGTKNWTFNNWSGSGSGDVVNGEYRLTVTTTANNYYDLQVVQPGIRLEQGKAYRLIYDARAASNRTLFVNVGMPVSPYTSFFGEEGENILNGSREVNLTTTKQTFTLDFIMRDPTYEDSRVEFSVGLSTPTVFVDNVSLYEIEAVNASLPVKASKANNITVRQNGNAVNISLNNSQNSRSVLNVYDLRGNVVRSATFNKNCSINTAGLPKGYYVVKVNSSDLVHKSGFVLK
ncbi:MAG: T9SS type A sorting domain-containing protein [Fibrobacter sp.]|jgi:GH35 family endo-1,4-beta-xylanase|nr:T9SS type A sorting domain-containing protein [Fibrobacter sp.]HON09725.1 endo-1,4-beta-xylanase [Chitinispirillaceae bacterium]